MKRNKYLVWLKVGLPGDQLDLFKKEDGYAIHSYGKDSEDCYNNIYEKLKDRIDKKEVSVLRVKRFHGN